MIVHPHYRRHGITNGFYHHLFKKFGWGNVFTRTWSTNPVSYTHLTVSVLPGTEAGEVIRGCIEQVQAWYEAGYWYPGDGGINVTQDDANAAFSQGRAACTFIYRCV